MRSKRPTISSTFNNPVLVGTVTILVVLVAVYLSYIAENGLPFVPVYNLNVQVADGGELNKNVDVRVGGARVGQVLSITPEPATKQWPHPYAKLEIAVQKSLEPLPDSTRYQVRLASILGGQYLELFPGKRKPGVKTVPDGGTLTLNKNPKLNHDQPYVDISQAFDVFGPRTQQGIRSVANSLGDAFAGRGTEINDGLYALNRLLGPLQSVLRIFADPNTDLGGFLNGLASTTAAIAPQASTLFDMLQNFGTTAHALNNSQLGTAIDDLPGTESAGRTALLNSQPVLGELASITQSLKPAAAELPTAARRLDTVLRTAPATLRLLGPTSKVVNGTLAATNTLAGTPAATQAFQALGVNDLGTAAASSFIGLGAILSTVQNEQDSCDVAGLWVRNFASALSEGNAEGNWLRTAPVINLSDMISANASKPSPDLHLNYAPVESGGQCQAGNEVYQAGKQVIGSPGTTGGTVSATAPPPGVYARGQNAGLVP